MKMRASRTAVAGLLGVGLAVAGCTSSRSSAAHPKTILNVATTAAITTWDPVKSFSTEVFYLANIYEPLDWVSSQDGTQKFTPALATSWESSADKQTWTFHLRGGVTFHDGEPMDSAAVKASVLAAQARGGASFIWAPLASVDTPDASTVVFHLKYAAQMDLIASSMYGAWIVAPRALAAEATDDKYFEKGIDAGTGPYTLSEYTPGQRVVLKAYAGYWGGWAGHRFTTVVNQITPESAVQQTMLQGHQVDIATSLPLENVKSLSADTSMQTLDCGTTESYVGFFNTSRKPLDNPLVRQALSYAIPYQDIITIGAQGYGVQSRGPVPKGIFPWSADTPQYTQDLDKAKALLAQAGVAPGSLSLNLTYASENQSEARFAPLIKDAFAKIGVTVDVKAILFNQQWEQAKADPAKAQDIFLLLYWPTYSDAGSDNLWSLFHSSADPYFNLSYWKNTQYDKYVDDAATKTATDQAAAAAEYEQAMQMLYQQAPGFFLYDVTAPLVVPKAIKGLSCNPDYAFNLFFYALSAA